MQHRRLTPAHHSFTNGVRYCWLDPDRPDDLTRHHWAWSSSRPAPVRFRRDDYGGVETGSLGDQVRGDLAPVLGSRPTGAVRMLSQLRHLGWLFNPITVFLAWHDDPARPVGAILEVTNTPWKERHRYPVPLAQRDGRLVARFAKKLHVSPFLDEAFDYELALDDRDDRVILALEVIAPGETAPTVSTRLDVVRSDADRPSLRAAMRAVPLSTHRVSVGIHAQALALWRKRVPFVAHPAKRGGHGPSLHPSPTAHRPPTPSETNHDH